MPNFLNEQEIKTELVIMLSNLDKLFDKLNLKYSIMSGTMLGAIRHKGFIPWDDDIDIGLPRTEYNKLLQAISDGCLEEFGYIAVGGELHNGNLPFIKILNINIKVNEPNNFRVMDDAYLWIDIFPFDYVRIDDVSSQIKKIKRYRNLLQKKTSQKFRYYKHKKGIRYLYHFAIYLMFYFLNIYPLIDKIIYLSCYCKERQLLMADLVWGLHNTKKCVPSSLFDELSDYQFENITVKGFKDYDTYLTCIYGDYMKLPPEDQRVNHGIKAWRVNGDEK